MCICAFVLLGCHQNHKAGKENTEDTVQEKNVPKGSFAYL